eukprot:3063016-Karenia_brevis.AAC.1
MLLSTVGKIRASSVPLRRIPRCSWVLIWPGGNICKGPGGVPNDRASRDLADKTQTTRAKQ